jgi:Rieske Fe-S protein
MQRRNFLKILATGAVVAVNPSLINGVLRADDGTLFQAYQRVKLVDANNNPIKASALEKEITYVFNYPFVGTPCLLINLPKKTERNIALKSDSGEEYMWKGGVGKEGSIVAYSGICAHQLTHPTPDDSFIDYVPTTSKTIACDQTGIIVCSSHLSAFDAGRGCKNIVGEARQPLACIVLEHDEASDELFAVAVLGPDKFQDYFKSFKDELKQYYGGRRKAKKDVEVSATLVKMTEFSKEIISY